MVTKIDKDQELLKAAGKVESLWEFLAFLVIAKKNLFWIILLIISVGVNIGMVAKYTNFFAMIFKNLLSVFGLGVTK
jgi:hypothetical protein